MDFLIGWAHWPLLKLNATVQLTKKLKARRLGYLPLTEPWLPLPAHGNSLITTNVRKWFLKILKKWSCKAHRHFLCIKGWHSFLIDIDLIQAAHGMSVQMYVRILPSGYQVDCSTAIFGARSTNSRRDCNATKCRKPAAAAATAAVHTNNSRTILSRTTVCLHLNS